MHIDEINKKLAQIMADEFGVPRKKLTEGANLAAEFGFDSLDMVEGIILIEETFKVEISDDEAEKIETYGDIVQLIRKKIP